MGIFLNDWPRLGGGWGLGGPGGELSSFIILLTCMADVGCYFSILFFLDFVESFDIGELNGWG